MLRMGALFAGYDGIGIAVRRHYGDVDLAWYSEIEPAAITVMRAHHPDVPNLGDVIAVDWSTVPRVDILTGGFPCQDVSSAGLRAGIREGTRSGLWSHMATAIDALRPSVIVIENVLGLLSAVAVKEEHGAARDVGCDYCDVEAGGQPALRALGAVLGDLSDVGYDARWVVVRASDAGAPHARARLFIVAAPDTDSPGRGEHGRPVTTAPQLASAEHAGHAPADADGDGHGLDVHPRTVGGVEGGTESQPPQRQRARGVTDAGSSDDAADTEGGRRGTRTRPAETAPGRVEPRTGDGGGTPAADTDSGRLQQRDARLRRVPIADEDRRVDWGKYGPAIRRWERLTRPAPTPTVPGARGRDLKMLGNGVVPQQAALALRLLLPRLWEPRPPAARDLVAAVAETLGAA